MTQLLTREPLDLLALCLRLAGYDRLPEGSLFSLGRPGMKKTSHSLRPVLKFASPEELSFAWGSVRQKRALAAVAVLDASDFRAVERFQLPPLKYAAHLPISNTLALA